VRARHPAAYLAAEAPAARVSEVRDVAASELPFEFALNALRLVDGFEITLFEHRTGLPAAVLEPPLEAARARGLIERHATGWRPTALGRRFLNDLQALFLPS
jgi:oxygen-independent coproporphyrinogen-3 oxidase